MSDSPPRTRDRDWWEDTDENGKPLVSCDDDECMAVETPETPEEVQRAMVHWRDHSFLHGCSHGH